MKASELRIGNMVYDNGEPHEIDANDIVLSASHEDGFFEPMELNEAWLEHFGFIERENGVFESKSSYINIRANGDRFTVFVQNTSISSIKYIHQLQNLHFSITEIELTY